jgi:Kef-type K+ transport system membrane component KefB
MFHQIQIQIPFIVTLLIVLLSAKVLGEVFERLGQPGMIGEVLAGILLGPSVFYLVQNTTELKVLSDLGVFLLIVLVGMEIEVEEIWKSIRGKNSFIALLGFIIPFISGFSVGRWFGFDNTFSTFLGLCIAITALPVSIRMLMDMGRLHSDVGQRIISAAIFNDVFALLVLGIILDFNVSDTKIRDIIIATTKTSLKMLVFIIILVVAYWTFITLKKQLMAANPRRYRLLAFLKGKQSMFALVILFILAFASIAVFLGLHFIVGAFFGAILFPRSLFAKSDFDEVRNNTAGITMGFLAPIFFASMGVEFNITLISRVWLLVVVIAVSFLSKILGGYLGGRMAGFGNRKSLTLGVGLNARGIMELVIANIALQNGFINTTMFSILVTMALLTTLVTPVLLKKAFSISDRDYRIKQKIPVADPGKPAETQTSSLI